MTIGKVADWTVENARIEARRYATQIDRDIDPRVEKANAIAATAAKHATEKRTDAPALVAWKSYIEARKPKWSERHLADHEAMAQVGGEPVTRGARGRRRPPATP
jgi:hypothetical protein